MSRTFVMVGANACGATAAATLREEGFDGRVVLIGEDPNPPYERPPLSKDHLRGEAPEPTPFRPPEWWVENDVETRFGERVDRLDAGGGAVVLADGNSIQADGVLLATGIRNRRLPGTDFDNVFSLRTLAESEAIRDAAAPGAHAVIVGMGFIGAEVAASLRQTGLEVTVVEPAETALVRALGPELGRLVEDMHREHGVVMRFGEGVDTFEGDGARVRAVVTSSGARLDCDLVVVGVGTQPNIEVAEASGIPVDNGILVDAQLRTSVPAVYAAGDVANHDHPRFGRIRVEHFDTAQKSGEAAARNLLGAEQPFEGVHWFWSDQYDTMIQMAGHSPESDRMVVRGDWAERRFAAFFLRDGVLEQALSFDWPRDVRRAMPLIRDRVRPDPEALADASVDLRTLA